MSEARALLIVEPLTYVLLQCEAMNKLPRPRAFQDRQNLAAVRPSHTCTMTRYTLCLNSYPTFAGCV